MRHALLATAALLIAAPSLAQQSAAPPEPQTVVITGRSLADTERAMKDCIARNCPVEEEINATLAHVENQFVAGKYQEAQLTLSSGLRRNRKHGKQYPVAVSDLMRANSRVADHMGEANTSHQSALNVHSILKGGLGRDDPRALIAAVDVADSFVKQARVESADRMYWDVIERARELNLPHIEAFAMLHAASLRSIADKDFPNEVYLRTRKDTLDKLIASSNPGHAPFIPAARALKARIAAANGDKAAIDTLITELKATPTELPVLIASDPVKLNQRPINGVGGSVSSTARMAVGDFEDEWIDVGFWVAPDGRTTDIEILRSGKNVDQIWVRPVLEQIRSRRYAPLKMDATAPGIMRVERFTYTAHWTQATGSRMRQRAPNPRLEMLDLSDDASVAKPVATRKEG